MIYKKKTMEKIILKLETIKIGNDNLKIKMIIGIIQSINHSLEFDEKVKIK